MRILLNNFKRMTVVCSLGLAIASISGNSAQAVVIDFEGITDHDGTGLSLNLGNSFPEDGFTLSVGDPLSGGGANLMGFGSVGSVSGAFAGSTSLFNQTKSNTTTLTRNGGGTFDIMSIQLSESDLNVSSSFSVLFTGIKAGGANPQVSFTLDGVFGTFTDDSSFTSDTFFSFGGLFTNLTSVTWDQGTGNLVHQFDNINVSPVNVIPLPAALPLYGTGLAVMGLLGWRRKRKAAQAA